MKKIFSASAMAAMAIMLSACCAQPELDGTWTVTSVAGEQVSLPDSLADATPFIRFDSAEGRIHGNSGCNIMNGAYTQDGNKLSFTGVATTMMAGPQELMELESKVLNAVNNAASVKEPSEGQLQICDAEGNVVMELSMQAEETPAVTEGQAEAAEETAEE